MSTTTITVPLDPETARLYTEVPPEVRGKLRLLLSLWLHEFSVPSRFLQAIMDETNQKAQERGLTPEILESLLNAK